ncbi:SPC24 protein, partial [Alcedo cyanopectus]|nr:SPC24 protein [Ceyx cyanopectus]
GCQAQCHSPSLPPTALRRELEELREEQQRLDEDTEQQEEAVPPAAYLTQLYYKISHIDWDYEADPTHVKGSEWPPGCPVP